MRILTNLPAAAICAMACVACDTTEPVVDEPSQYIAVTRAWAPGERAGTINQIETTGALAFFSPYASVIFSDPDSVTEVQLNPDWVAPVASHSPGLAFSLARFSTAWTIAGIRLESYNDSQVPPDTLIWTGIFYFNPNNPDQRGFIIRGGAGASFGPENVNSAAFEATNNRLGAGGGEVDLGNGTEWTAGGPTIPNRNTIEVSSQTYGGSSTVTTGPWLGGQLSGGTMRGRSKRVSFSRIAGTGNPTTFEVDLDFRGGIQALRIVCNFPTPCTTNVPLLRDLP